MSLGYAERLSFRDDLGGQLGAPELFDGPAEVEVQAQRLADLVTAATRIIGYTGAGISTSAGIPDFRGPSGIWTLQRAGQPLPRPKVSFTHAKPSLTHQVLVALMRAGKMDFLVSQNVDGLHLRSGVPRNLLAELHGNCFAERCTACGTEYVRDFEIETVGFKRTGRRCSQSGCGAALIDHILDWEDALPEDELQLSEMHAKEADLAICIGTSLQITPACNLPLKTTRTYKGGGKEFPGKLVIINLQKTQHDSKAVKSGGIVCHARCDEIMGLLARKLQLPVPPYVRRDAVVVGHQQHGRSGADASSRGPRTAAQALGSEGNGSGGQPLPFSLFVQSSHGPKCPMPMVLSVDISFEDPELLPASLKAPPFAVRRTSQRAGPVRARVVLHLHQAADEDKRTVQLDYTATLQAGHPPQDCRQEEQHEFITQVVHYTEAAAEATEQAGAGRALAAVAALTPGDGRGAQPAAPAPASVPWQTKKQRV